MDWREDIGRKSQYTRIPDDEAGGEVVGLKRVYFGMHAILYCIVNEPKKHFESFFGSL